jgi:predicted nucleic acid-binding protein
LLIFSRKTAASTNAAAHLIVLRAGDICIVTSALTIAECLWLRGSVSIPKNRAQVVRRFFWHSYVRVRNVTRKTAELAQDLVWDHSVRPKDAIHVATALEARVPVIETFDRPLVAKTGLIGTPPLVIREPVGPVQARLFP